MIYHHISQACLTVGLLALASLKNPTMHKACLVALLSVPSACVAADASTRSTQLYWGDTHVHSSWSVDAYSMGNINADPDTAYRFAKGEPVLHPVTKMRIRIGQPLDFLVVADHAEMLRLQKRLEEDDPSLLATPSGQRLRKMLREDPAQIFREIVRIENGDATLVRELFTAEIRQGSWAAEVDMAERHNSPGKFTTFAGWEWSSTPGMANLHRVIFTPADGATAKQFVPFSSYDSDRPEDLWKWLESTHARTGADFIAIPHNSNLSKGLMFDTVDSHGRPITAEYARTRMRWEPVMEVTQMKGTSEVHPALTANDEFASFEIYEELLGGGRTPPHAGDYARSALLRGLQIGRGTGVNPYQLGFVGSTDTHTGLSSVEENNFYGKSVQDTLPAERAAAQRISFPAWRMSASGLAGVWAAENTRAAIAAAFVRKEVYATTGPRIALRVFGGFHFRQTDAVAKDVAALGYRRGVPMGGDLTAAPRNVPLALLIHAVKDPTGANLDRVQVIKGWLDAHGGAHERVYDVAWSHGRTKDPNGKLQSVGDTVDVTTASYANTIGDVQLSTVWSDPDFDPTQTAFYYVRVLEIPTPRHSVHDTVALQADPASPGKPLRIQERAYSSPIWYTPARS